MSVLRTLGRSGVFLLLLASVASGAGSSEKAKRYVNEVKKHLLESYIERERLSTEVLEAAGLQGLLKSMHHKDFLLLDGETKSAIRKAVRESDSVAEALDAVAEVDDDIDMIKFADHATRAMVKETGDPFSKILTEQEFNKLLKILQGGESRDNMGLGILWQDGKASVVFVQYGYVGYDEGIQIGDEVLSIGGDPVSKLDQSRINERLKKTPGQSLKLTIRRKGIDRKLDFHLVQRNVVPKEVLYAMLGDGVGYIRMTIFGMGLVSETKKALRELKKDGMQSCILDLRNNPGGMLPACTSVADLFLDQGLVITKTISHYTPSIMGIKLPFLAGNKNYKTKKETEFETMPMVLLINGSSASASEMLAGAMKDHGRATLVGTTTYGKGVGQSPIMLSSMMMKRFLYLTILRYTTPNGNEVNHVGIEPEVAYPGTIMKTKEFLGRWDLRKSGKILKYLDRTWDENENTFVQLAEYDHFEAKRYPRFDDFYKGLETSLTRDQVRSEIRREIRRKLVIKNGEVFTYDLQSDLQLQRGLVELLDRNKEKK